ncbi:unnamed protein product [marine sediment metagenome]|uniref:Uncharacterized protein n=1 Tax=marine sediment metagenome TaxID=412755 RepID=X1JGV5_9ZZZZ
MRLWKCTNKKCKMAAYRHGGYPARCWVCGSKLKLAEGSKI